MEEFISKIQYLIGDLGHKFLAGTNQSYASASFQKILELNSVLEYFTSDDIVNKEQLYIDQLISFFSARYNLTPVPYITYPGRVTNILYGFGTGDNTFVFSGVGEAPVDNQLYTRKNNNWFQITLPTTPLTDTLVTNWNLSYSWGDHSIVGYALSTDLHNATTLGTANGLSLVGQQLSLALATVSSSGAMSDLDKTKLDSLVVHDAITLGTPNGLNLSNQILSLDVATVSNAGAMSNTDKIKIDSLANYIHPTGFVNKPSIPLVNRFVVSQILITDEGHVSDIVTREIDLSIVGITPSSLAVVNNTNLELVLTGTPLTALLEDVTITSNWVGLLSVDNGGTGVGTFATGELLVGNGAGAISTISRNGIDTRTTFPVATHNLTSHSDVNISVPTTNQVLTYNGTSWINSTLDISGITFTETDPIFVGFRDTVRTANTIYAAPNGSDGIGAFRSLTIGDIPNAYVRFDISQSLTEVQKQRVRTSIGVQVSGAYELAFSKGNAITSTGTVLSITNGTSRVIGISDLIIDHAVSGWVDKTALANAFIISDLVVDSFGHIADWTTRELTLADLGYVGFDPAVIQTTLDDHETRISVLEGAFPTLNGDKNFVHAQGAPNTIWTIAHNLGKKPSITIIDSAGSQIWGKITYVDLNNVILEFSSATSGEAIFN